MDEKELAIVAVREAGILRSQIASIKGGVSLVGLKSLWENAPAVVKHVEAISATLAGADKLLLATEILCELVDVWWLPDWAIRKFAPSILESALSALKGKLNP